MQEYPMLAKTFKGLEDVLAQELTELGANNIHIERRAVSFSGDKALMYKANLCLRTASRILKPILTFRAKDADEVYETVKTIDWTQYMSTQTGFSIDSTVYSEEFRHSKYVTYRVKDAIADFFMEREGKRPSVKLTQPDLYINVHISDTTVTISLDSSGESLHKRGYRVANTEAPINEALAAGMILMTGWKGETDFYDPMCGSGTLLIEAALIAQNIAPGIFRQNYAFCKWADFDADLWSDIYNDDSNERAFTHHIYGSDTSFYAVQAALKNIKEAGMGRFIDVKQIRLQEIKREQQTPAIVMINPPYGERLAQDKDVLRLYADIGTALKHQFTGSTAWIISSNEDALKCIGLHPNKKVHLMNGELDCLFNCYELFSGERKEFVKTHPHRPQSERAPQAKPQRVAHRSHGQGSGTPRGGKGFARSRR